MSREYIENASHIKYLGIYLDRTLNLVEHK